MQNIFNLFDLLCILKTYLLQNELIRQRKQEGGGGEQVRFVSGESNHKVEFLLKT